MVASKAASKSIKFSKEWVWRRLRIFANYFKGLAVFLFRGEYFLSLKYLVAFLIRCQSPFFEKLLYFDIAGEQ